MGGSIFVTGATGFLGKRFVRELAARKPGRILLLIRPRGGETPTQRLKSLGLDLPGVEAVEGDIADPTVVEAVSARISRPVGTVAEAGDPPEPCLGSSGGRAGVSPRWGQRPSHGASTAVPVVDEFWHIAGLTEFHESKRPQLEQVNIEGTRHALALAQRWGVRRFFHISTAYVAGVCDGPVPEDGLLPNPVFRNAYEETKYRGEQLVRESGLPWTVIRPSILMGDSVTGENESDKMAYGVCKVYHSLAQWVRREQRGDASHVERQYRVRAEASASKNCLCVDDAVRLMLAVRNDGTGHTYHCCHVAPSNMGRLHESVVTACAAPFLTLVPSGDTDPRPQATFSR